MPIISDLEFVNYLATPGLSNSQLNHLKKSPAHFKYYLQASRKQTDSMLIGEAVHCRALQPELFETRYATRPSVDGRTKEGKEVIARFQADNEGKIILDYDQHKTVWNVTEFLRLSERFNALTSKQDIEQSIFWMEDGVECKGRADVINNNLHAIIDLKTTQSATRSAFARSVYLYGYHRQAAYYKRGLAANGINIQHFIFIVIETTPPYCFSFMRLTDEAIAAGDKEIDQLLAVYRECLTTDKWPGYSEDINDVGLPEWATKEQPLEEGDSE